MKRPTLHRAGNHWLVGEYPLILAPVRQGWRVASPVSASGADWITRSGLARQIFRTRRQALQAVMDALEIHPGLQQRPPAPCVKIDEGWRLAGGMIAVRGGPGWNVLDRGQLTGSARTLRQAAHLALLRLDRSDVFADTASQWIKRPSR